MLVEKVDYYLKAFKVFKFKTCDSSPLFDQNRVNQSVSLFQVNSHESIASPSAQIEKKEYIEANRH